MGELKRERVKRARLSLLILFKIGTTLPGGAEGLVYLSSDHHLPVELNLCWYEFDTPVFHRQYPGVAPEISKLTPGLWI